jgi:hypothetical protein
MENSMEPNSNTPSRRHFIERLGGAGAALSLGACVTVTATRAPARSSGAWDLSWLDRVRGARHRAVFDDTQGNTALMLASRYLDNLQAVYGAASPDVIAIVNLRVGAASIGLRNEMWLKYPIGEDRRVTDAATGAPARRNIDYSPAADAEPGIAAMTLERLHARGAIFLVCDFALGHLADRLATKVGATADVVHRDLREGLVPGGFMVPSGIFGLGEAQNAGCAFVAGGG